MPKRLKANLTLLLVALVWGSSFAVQRVAALNNAVFLFNGLRFILGALILIPLAARGGKRQITQAELRAVGVTGLILFAASALQQAGMRFTTAGNAGFITSLYVVFVPLLLLAGWRERPAFSALLAVFLAALGAYLLSTNGNFSFQLGDFLVLLGAVFFALHVVVIEKLGGSLDSLRFAIGQFLLAGVLSLLVGAVLERPAVEAWPSIWGGVIYTGILSVGVGYTLQIVAQKHTPPTEAALILALEAVVAVLAGWLLLGELLLPLQIVGCGLILLAVVLAQIKDLKQSLE